MSAGVGEALILTLAMGAAIFFCRVFPFLFFRGKADGDGRGKAFLGFVERTVPPVAMTVLAFNSLAAPARAGLGDLAPAIAAGALTAAVHLWRRNPMISIFAGTAAYMALIRVLG